MKKISLWLLFGFLFNILNILPVVSNGSIIYTDPAFATNWQRVDKPVRDLPGVGRGYTWGPTVPGSELVTLETYDNKARKVQYFDKARMELNNPAGNSDNLFYVTTGLLTKELVTGLRQDGDNTFTQVAPSLAQVVGDPNDGGLNSKAPTYSSFKNLANFFGNEHSKPSTPGATLTAKIDKAGNVTQITPPQLRLVGGYDHLTGHNIADVFVDFSNKTGLVWDAATSSYLQASVLYGNPVYVLGRPITEPYWTRAEVKGLEMDVLVQLFERRVLTYTPSNPEAYKVEMGNIGQHYFRWRYALSNFFPTDFSQPAAAYNKKGAKPVGGASNVVTYSSGGDRIDAFPPAISSDQKTLVFGDGTKGILALDISDPKRGITQKWAFQPLVKYTYTTFSSPLIYKQVVYFCDNTGRLYALDVNDGRKLWEAEIATDLVGENNPIISTGTPITDGENLYFSIGNAFKTKLVAVKLVDGTGVWKIQTDASFSDPIFNSEGNLMVESGIGMQIYNRAGVRLNQPGQNTNSQFGFAYANNLTYRVINRELVAENSEGTVVDRVRLSDTGFASYIAQPVVSEGRVYISYSGGTIYQPDSVGGILGFSATNLKGQEFKLILGKGVSSLPTITVADGYLYFGVGRDFYQVAVNDSSIKTLLFTGSSVEYSTAIVANSKVYVLDFSGNLYVVS